MNHHSIPATLWSLMWHQIGCSKTLQFPSECLQFPSKCRNNAPLFGGGGGGGLLPLLSSFQALHSLVISLTWTYVDCSSGRFCGIHLGMIDYFTVPLLLFIILHNRFENYTFNLLLRNFVVCHQHSLISENDIYNLSRIVHSQRNFDKIVFRC